jgi:hypothetical protein
MRKVIFSLFLFLVLFLFASCNNDLSLTTEHSITTIKNTIGVNTTEPFTELSLKPIPNNLKILNQCHLGDTFAGYSIVKCVYETETEYFEYPQIENLQDEIKQMQINELLKKAGLAWAGNYTSADKGTAHCKYEVKISNDYLFSVSFLGYIDPKHAAYPSAIFYTINIDVADAKIIRLKDIVMISDDFINLVYQPYTEQLQSILDADNRLYKEKVLEDCWKPELIYADLLFDETGRGTYSYFTENMLVISIEAPHVLGDYAEIKIPYAYLVDCLQD